MAGEAPADAVERLYGLPLDRFTGERNDLAKRLRAEGDREAAAAVQALRKPPLAIWALNQAARECRDDVRVLLRAGERLREDPEGAARDLRAAVDGLVRRARDVLEEAGRSGPAALGTVAATARAAALAAPDELRRGVLDRELEPVGFEALGAFVPAAGRAGAPRAPREAAKGAPGEARRRAREARAAREAVAKAQARARELRREADAAEREAARAREAADRADEELARAEEALRRLRDGG